jgi:hypothetical protein
MEKQTSPDNIIIRKLNDVDKANVKYVMSHFSIKTASRAVLRTLGAFLDLNREYDRLQEKHNRALLLIEEQNKHLLALQGSISFIQNFKPKDLNDSKDDHPSFI